jgi:hypothetical protein
MTSFIYSITHSILWPFIIVIGILVLIAIIYAIFRSKAVEKNQYAKSLDRVMMLVKVSKQTGKKEEELRDSKEMAILFSGVAEQMFASLSSIYQKGWHHNFYGQKHLTFEIAAINGDIGFYVTCPRELQMLIEKQIHGFYPSASIEIIEDYNIFKNDPNYQIAGTALSQTHNFVYPIKSYRFLESDSLGTITNVLSKMGEDASAAIQIAIRPTNNSWRKACENAAKNLQAGKDVSTSSSFTAKEFAKSAHSLAKEFGKAAAAKEGENKQTGIPTEPVKLTPIQEQKLQSLEQKASKVGFDTHIRIVTCAKTQEEADAHLENIASSFAQFNAPELNGFKKASLKKDQLLRQFIFRTFGNSKTTMLLNAEEIASIYHFPNKGIETPGILWLSAKDAPPPANLPNAGTFLGQSIYRGEAKNVFIKDDDRRRHIYAIGKTGTGKTTLFTSMALADIKAGKGVCYIDPHGDAIDEILKGIPKERANDLVLFDPSDIERPYGLNLLEWKEPSQKDFLVQELVQIFYKLFDPEHTGIVGPQFEHWLRNAALTLMSDPKGGTIIEIPRLFTDDQFREEKIANLKDPIVLQFWKKQMAQTADFHKSEMLNYFTSKFGRFMTNEMMRNVIGQTTSSFDFREIMDNGKIFLVNLSKGKVGEVNSNLLGMILVAKLQMAAMSRADISEDQRRDFHLYVDEFQNFATENFEQILSEARKYHLSLNITNQYVAQLEERIRDAVFGNIGTLISFRIGASDAEFIEKEFAPVFTHEDLISVDKFHAYVKLLIDGVASKPFSMKTVKFSQNTDVQTAKMIRESARNRYGRDRGIVEKEIAERAKIKELPPPALPPLPPPREVSR